ncbi:yjeF N-terminal domain-containing 3 isoform X4 [Alosa sapidissima]|uniref:yjeF N-terminal domain-containing 3 isoform X4 n=1 Tax=Alosa sapidissima TaxID=34773 RepID=UPI001C098858|nr:yjeF N-terminal domain-containing 3 isoform X4 [Alosa sapidissima]
MPNERYWIVGLPHGLAYILDLCLLILQTTDKMNHSSNEPEVETTEPLHFLSKVEASAIETELLRDYRFGQQQLIEIWGYACAIAITKEYEPTIYYPKRSSHSVHQDFTVQCEKMDIPFLSYLPTEVQLINDAYNLVIDATLGPESDPKDIKEPYSSILVTLKQVKIPIASVDVPLGWDADEADKEGISPEVLISLVAPKKCATNFSGKHFLAGRFLPYDIQKKYELNLPEFPETECLIEL